MEFHRGRLYRLSLRMLRNETVRHYKSTRWTRVRGCLTEDFGANRDMTTSLAFRAANGRWTRLLPVSVDPSSLDPGLIWLVPSVAWLAGLIRISFSLFLHDLPVVGTRNFSLVQSACMWLVMWSDRTISLVSIFTLRPCKSPMNDHLRESAVYKNRDYEKCHVMG